MDEKVWTFRFAGSISIADQNPNTIADYYIEYDIDVTNGCEDDTIGYGSNTVASLTYTIGSGNTPTY